MACRSMALRSTNSWRMLLHFSVLPLPPAAEPRNRRPRRHSLLRRVLIAPKRIGDGYMCVLYVHVVGRV